MYGLTQNSCQLSLYVEVSCPAYDGNHVSEQTLTLVTQQFCMGYDPGGIGPAATVLFLGMDAAVPAPFPAGELGTADDPGEFFDRIPFPDLLTLNEGGQHGFKTLQSGHYLFVHDRFSLAVPR
jgi:hypothetical protein